MKNRNYRSQSSGENKEKSLYKHHKSRNFVCFHVVTGETFCCLMHQLKNNTVLTFLGSKTIILKQLKLIV